MTNRCWIRKAQWLLVFTVLVSGCATRKASMRSTSQDEGAYGAYLRGLFLEREDNLEEALRAYREAQSQDNDSPYLFVRLGATYVKLGQPVEALKAFQQALTIEPEHPDALRWWAMVSTAQGDLEGAIEAYEKLVELQTEDRFMLSTLADLYVLKGDLRKAIPLYHQLIDIFGPTNHLHFNLGVLYGRLSEFDQSLAHFEEAVNLDPKSIETLVGLGIVYELKRDYQGAAVQYLEAINLDPANIQLYKYAARAYLGGRLLEEAAEQYRKMLQLSPGDFDGIMGLVRIWIAEREFDQAKVLLQEKLEEFGESPAVYVALGLVYRESGDLDAAIDVFEKAITLSPDSAQAHFYLATLLDQIDQEDVARIHLRKVLESNPNHSDALNYLGYLDAEAGVNLDEAKDLIERAVAIDPENGAYLDSLGWVYFQQGRVEEAIAYLEKAKRLLENDATIFDHLGDAYFSQGDIKRAENNWQRALEWATEEEAESIQQKLQKLN